MSGLLRRTPFHDRVAPLCESSLWERWNGYATVSVFRNETDEYFAVRNAASLYDVSPMLKYRIDGADAERVVNRIVTRDVTRLAPGRALYTAWCDGGGKVIEDGTVFRLAPDRFRINCAEPQLPWFEDSAWGFAAKVTEESDEVAGLALQGPLSRAVLEDVGLGEAGTLPTLGLGRFPFDGGEVLVSRTGYTGDLGFELWIASDRALQLWDRLMTTTERRFLRPIGARALNVTRIEAGHILVNADYIGASRALRPSQARSPYELGLGWTVDLRKERFNGRVALAAEKSAGGPRRRLVGLDISGRRSAAGAYLYRGRREVGQVTSATWSPLLKKNIALATVEAPWSAPGTELMADIYYKKEVTQARVEARATVVDHRFLGSQRRMG
jgi:aminomethyltransferase